MWKLLLALALTAWSGSALAEGAMFDDLLGTWCQTDPDDGTMVFTQEGLTIIFADKRRRTLQIEKIVPHENQIEIFWVGLESTFYEISPGKGTLIQLHNHGGDNGPRREFKRC